MKVHVGLNVTNLEKSVEFYTTLFGENPVKRKENYVKFLPQIVPLNFTLTQREKVEGNQVGHFGIQVSSPEELQQQLQRIKALGYPVKEEDNTTCCYALQDKFWLEDPNGNEWEFFFTKADVEENSNNQTACCVK